MKKLYIVKTTRDFERIIAKKDKNDYIVILRGSAKTSDFKRLSDDFISLMKKIEVENEK